MLLLDASMVFALSTLDHADHHGRQLTFSREYLLELQPSVCTWPQDLPHIDWTERRQEGRQQWKSEDLEEG